MYGDDSRLRPWLEENRKSYVLCVTGKAHVWQGHRQVSIKGLLANAPEGGWFTASCGDGSKGARMYDWQTIQINPGAQPGFGRWALIRRSKTAPEGLRAYLCFAPTGTAAQKLVETAGCRWTVEACFKEGKSYVGLDQYEARSYGGWYKHVTLACIALTLLTVLSLKSLDTKSLQGHQPDASSLEGFKKGRNLHV